MPKKDKKGASKSAAPTEQPSEDAGPWTCTECEQENEASDEACCACEEPRPVAAAQGGRYEGYKVGVIVSAEKVPNKDKLTVCKVDVGDAESLQVVTNAPNAAEGVRVVVATVGATFPGDSGEDEVVKKGAVGGIMSHGMLCNGPMLGWKGGDAKCAATVPDSFAVGSTPPDTRPRGGKDA